MDHIQIKTSKKAFTILHLKEQFLIQDFSFTLLISEKKSY